MELLSCLSPRLHPGHAVAGWAQHGLTDDMPCDPVLVTTAVALADPEFQRALAELPTEFYAAIVDGGGQLELRRHSAHGWRVVRTAQLDLDELLKPPAQTRPLPLTKQDPDRSPAILRTDPFPLRLTHALEAGHLWRTSEVPVFSLASAGRVMCWDHAQKGARQVGIELPSGRVAAEGRCWIKVQLSDPSVSALVGSSATQVILRGKTWTLLTADPDRLSCRSIPLQATLTPTDQAIRALITRQCAFLIARSGIQAFSLETGELLAEMPVDKRHALQYVGHQYLKNHQGHWTRLSFDGQIHLTPVTDHAQSVMLAVPPAGLSEDETVCLPCFRGTKLGDKTIPNYQESSIDAVCQRGSLVMLAGKFSSLNGDNVLAHPGTAVWDLDEEEWKWTFHYFTTDFDEVERRIAVGHVKPRPNLRHKFSAVYFGSQGVFLQSSKRALWKIAHLPPARMRLVHDPKIPDPVNRVSFDRLNWPGSSIPFRSAQLPNGNSVWLDGRGLMHLMPARLDRLEITLVLDENHLSGWLSDGRAFGDPYYFDDHLPQADLGEVYNQHLMPFFDVVP